MWVFLLTCGCAGQSESECCGQNGRFRDAPEPVFAIAVASGERRLVAGVGYRSAAQVCGGATGEEGSSIDGHSMDLVKFR
jgi:hypothetical protein